MVKLTRIYTRGGDTGQTSLGSGERISKSALRVECIGEVDEANAAIGWAREMVKGTFPDVDILLARIQNDLFDLGADLCIPEPPGVAAGTALRIVGSQVASLEKEIDSLNEKLEPLNSFILPGGSQASAALHIGRTVVRRAERAIIKLHEVDPINLEAIKYLNRLSDLLFVLCRHVNNNGKADVLWVPGKSGL